jgi:sulfur-carrier protein adenylyltransferase/sulfurtransferase
MTGARPTIREVGLAEGVALARDGHRVIDVREPGEWATGHVSGASLLPLAEVRARIEEVAPDRDTPLLLHCAVGERSAAAAAWISELGYRTVVNLRADIGGWADAGGAWEGPAAPPPDEPTARYARQELVPEIGPDGQRALAESRVLIVGAGGLGSPAALYLAAAGVGTIGMVDDDVVDPSNLHRQVLHTTGRIGARKVDSARTTLQDLNPLVEVVTHDERLRADNVAWLLDGYDVIVDGTDSLEARYLINDAAVRLRRPVVHGSVHRWEGQVTTFAPGGPCYRCLHPEPPPPELAPACSVAGVVGVVPGVVGMLQATEVLKLLLGAGETLAGRLLLVDALHGTFDEIRVPRDPGCPACGDRRG